MLVKKASGLEELFQVEKLEKSLRNAGAGADIIEIILKDLEKFAFPGITTKKIYSRAFSQLKKYQTSIAVRYKLKQAILELGPTGYPFENLIGQLFEHKGYSCEVGIIVNGQCTTHEMDVIATGELQQHLCECKYHLSQGSPVSIQVPLYVRSRVNDIVDYRERLPDYKDFTFIGWVVTNTRLSLDSIEYGRCSGLKLLAWDYPAGNGLKEQLEHYKLYPVTVMTSLTKQEKQAIIAKGVITCRQILQNQDMLKDFQFSEKKSRAVFQEAEEICGI
jgi:hypothetical protein